MTILALKGEENVSLQCIFKVVKENPFDGVKMQL